MDDLEVESYDNRGSKETPFGFVYFTDGTRVMYVSDPEKTIAGSNWGHTTPKHRELAKAMLEAEKVWPS